jgi:hypothetical protein
MGAIHVEYIFHLYFYIFLARFIALKIDCAVVCLLFAVKMARFANFVIINYKKGALDSQPQVIKFTSCLPRVGGSLRVLRLLPPLKLVAMI